MIKSCHEQVASAKDTSIKENEQTVRIFLSSVKHLLTCLLASVKYKEFYNWYKIVYDNPMSVQTCRFCVRSMLSLPGLDLKPTQV